VDTVRLAPCAQTAGAGCAIAQILREGYSAEATRSWLMARNRLLGFDRPIDRLGHGDFAAVREAAEAFVDGDYT
jgi:hypothetical protein